MDLIVKLRVLTQFQKESLKQDARFKATQNKMHDQMIAALN